MKKSLLSSLLISPILAMQSDTIIDALHVKSPSYNPSIRILQYNIDRAVREEQFENTRWNTRAPRVIGLIKDANADIICLQELRELPETPSVNRFLAEFDDYRYTIAHRGPSKLAFGQATLYKSDKFFLLNSFPLWLSDTPEKVSDTWTHKRDAAFGNIVLCTQFMHVKDGKIVEGHQPFWIFNVHFGLDESVKTKSCYKLLEIIKKVAGKEPYIVCGDFNFFPDREGNKQRVILTHTMIDHGKDAITLGGKHIEGTFVGFEHDEFKADLSNMQSRLDHIFGSHGTKKEQPPVLYTKTMLDPEPEELTTRDYPSDHLPLLAILTLPTKH